jgi:hypothetical protein
MEEKYEKLINKIIKYIHPITRFERYGKVIGIGKTVDLARKNQLTKNAKRRLKRPTTRCLVIRDWDKTEVRVPYENIKGVHRYGKDRQIEEFLKDGE